MLTEQRSYFVLVVCMDLRNLKAPELFQFLAKKQEDGHLYARKKNQLFLLQISQHLSKNNRSENIAW